MLFAQTVGTHVPTTTTTTFKFDLPQAPSIDFPSASEALGAASEVARVLLPWVWALVATLAVVEVLYWLQVRRALRRRVVAQYLPEMDFDPSLEEVAAFWARLSGAAGPRSLRTPRRCGHVRFMIAPSKAGLVHFVEAPSHASPELFAAMPGIRVSKRDALPTITGRYRVRTELVLARDSEPLRTLKDYDLLGSFAQAFAICRQSRSVRVMVDLLPAKLSAPRRRATGSKDEPMERGRALTLPGRAHRKKITAVGNKMADGETPAYVQVLIEATGNTRKEALSLLSSATKAFRPLHTDNSFVSRRRWFGLWQLGPNGARWLCGRYIDFRLRHSLFSHRRKDIVVTSEVWGLLKPPTVACVGHVARRGGEPLSKKLPYTHHDMGRNLVCIGRGIDGDVGWDMKRFPHLLATGETRSGKSSFLRALIAECLVKEWPVAVCDAKGSSFSFLLGRDGVYVARTLDEMTTAVANFYLEMERRYGIIDHARADRRPLPPGTKHPAVLIIDEFTSLVTDARQANSKGEAPVVVQLGQLLRKGGECRTHVILSAQRPDAKYLDGEFKRNLGARLGIGLHDQHASTMTFDDAQEGRRIDPLPGRALFKTEEYVRLQTWWLADPSDFEDTPPEDRLAAEQVFGAPRVKVDTVYQPEDAEPRDGTSRRRGRKAG